MRVAINGFGRIGRAVFRIAETLEDIEIVAINDLFDDEALRYLLTYDTVMGRFEGDVRSDSDLAVAWHGDDQGLIWRHFDYESLIYDRPILWSILVGDILPAFVDHLRKEVLPHRDT